MKKNIIKITAISLFLTLVPVIVIVLAVVLSQPKEFILTIDTQGYIEDKGSIALLVNGEEYNQPLKIERGKSVEVEYIAYGYNFDCWNVAYNENTDEVQTFNTKSLKFDMFEDVNCLLDLNIRQIAVSLNGVASQNFSYGDALGELADLDGKKFAGWKIDGDTNSEVYNFATFEQDAVSLVPYYTLIEYDIVYNLNGGVNNVNNPTSFNVESQTITFVDAEKTGYTFDGWFSEEGFVNQVVSVDQGTFENKELFAKWTIIEYYVTFKDENDNQVGDIQTFTIEDSEITIPNVPVKEGHKGVWGSFDTQVLENQIVNPIYTEIIYDITFNDANGSQIVKTDVAYNTDLNTLLDNYSAENEDWKLFENENVCKYFYGWKLNNISVTLANFDEENVTLVADWRNAYNQINFEYEIGDESVVYTSPSAITPITQLSTTIDVFEGEYFDIYTNTLSGIVGDEYYNASGEKIAITKIKLEVSGGTYAFENQSLNSSIYDVIQLIENFNSGDTISLQLFF